jgi:hypothetical protein
MNGSEEESRQDGVTIRLIKHIIDMPYDQQVALLTQLDEALTGSLELADRTEKRKPFTSNVSFSLQGVSYHGVSEDISPGGMFIKTDDSFIAGQTIVLTLQYADKKRRAKIPAEIVRIREDGIGVKFMKKSS